MVPSHRDVVVLLFLEQIVRCGEDVELMLLVADDVAEGFHIGADTQ